VRKIWITKLAGIAGYFNNFLSQRLGAYGFSCKDLSDFPISFPNFSWIISIVLQKIGLTMKKSLQV